MTMTLHTKSSGVALLHQIQGNELEPLNRQQLKIPLDRPLGEMYVDSNKTGVYNYQEGAAYDFNTAAAPVYGSSNLTYAPNSETFGSNGLGGFHSPNNVSPSPLVLGGRAPTAPALSLPASSQSAGALLPGERAEWLCHERGRPPGFLQVPIAETSRGGGVPAFSLD